MTYRFDGHVRSENASFVHQQVKSLHCEPVAREGLQLHNETDLCEVAFSGLFGANFCLHPNNNMPHLRNTTVALFFSYIAKFHL